MLKSPSFMSNPPSLKLKKCLTEIKELIQYVLKTKIIFDENQFQARVSLDSFFHFRDVMKRLMDSNKMSGLLVLQKSNTKNPIGGKQSFSC